MYEHLETKNVIARKQHKCDWCGKPISKGEEYERQKYKYDGASCMQSCCICYMGLRGSG